MKVVKRIIPLVLVVLTCFLAVFGCDGCSCKKCSSCEKVPDPSYTEDGNCILYENYSYGDAGVRNLFDLGLPKNKQGDLGMVMFVHGGGWVAGDKSGNVPSIKDWCQKGYASSAINYRYIDKNTDCDELMDDISSALYKMKTLASEKGINLNKVILIGGSAGAHLSLQYAYTMQGFAPITPVGAVSLSGPTDMYDAYYYNKDGKYYETYLEWFTWLSGHKIDPDNLENSHAFLRKVSPLYAVNPTTVPTIICHGVLDDIVPISNANALDQKLTANGVAHRYFVFNNSGHGLENNPEVYAQYNTALDEYASLYLN